MKTTLSLIVVLIVFIGGYFLFTNKTQAPVTNPELATATNSAPREATGPTPEAPAAGAPATTGTPAAKTVTVTYTGSTFSPNSVSIRVGDTVTFVNSGSAPMWVATNNHPAHQGYSGTTKDQHCPDTQGMSFDQCSVGSSYTFTFTKAGSWGYHNHVSSGAGGTIVVSK